ncbi:epidermal growth factor receptor kinase substrate 8-like protein 3b isoform 1-T3 [Clarias gariepinus]|uniref:epidermal growth factor receptor kinase substrate 8-like protein 3b n=1 Tax=Clarias gariepinus TaxID=13013 RepID=UPI00234C180C|nr:epidermal growth factor receptor kinase substrate 8-like protein 3b [Clarias gariepinus]XP_053360324.1 epidermal growth factor receptor kinase substrate 8-like protein 3b [Clarias gariepinus]XP_053360325.1 epidermal growth factor receptor kinase substrate 8-like protein 3b [Clarias gariepinus]
MFNNPASRGFSSEASSQMSDMSRPSAKSIYMQRKEYLGNISRQADAFQYRVEHLFTCELNGRDVRSTEDCVTKLKSLESRGKVWGQDMILQVQGSHLQLCDVETKELLDSLPLGSILQTKAILDSCAYDSLLIVTAQDNSQRVTNVFVFQCEETGAEELKADLESVIQNRDERPGFSPSEPPFDIRSNLENIIGQGYSGGFRKPGLSPMHFTPPPPEYPPPHSNFYQDYDDHQPPMFSSREENRYSPDMRERQNHIDQQPPLSKLDIENNVEILNHALADIEIFIVKVQAALSQENGKKKKLNKKKNQGEYLPSVEEFVACLQKMKYSFNLIGKLKGHLANPGAPEFIHSLLSSIAFLRMQYPPNVAPSVVFPLLTEQALQLLTQEVTREEDQLWNSLGDAWNIPRSKWPNAEQIPPYVPQFYDGWQPPAPAPAQLGPMNQPLSRSNSQRFPAENGIQQRPGQDNRPFGAPPERSGEPPLSMRVMYNFTARNRQELSVMKGDVVQVVHKSRQWWVVRNNRGEEGSVPPNVLEPINAGEPPRMNRPPNLDMKSSPEDVRAWLQYKGFSNTTIRNLGMMNGALLLGMRREDIRAVCPEEGGRVFFQLQAVKSSVALASEAEYNHYNGR